MAPATTHPDPDVERLLAKAEKQIHHMRRHAGGTLRLQAFGVRETMQRVIDHVDEEVRV